MDTAIASHCELKSKSELARTARAEMCCAEEARKQRSLQARIEETQREISRVRELLIFKGQGAPSARAVPAQAAPPGPPPPPPPPPPPAAVPARKLTFSGKARPVSKFVMERANAIGWRNTHCATEWFTLPGGELGPKAKTLKVRQILCGEEKLIGTGSTVWDASTVLLRYLERAYERGQCAEARRAPPKRSHWRMLARACATGVGR